MALPLAGFAQQTNAQESPLMIDFFVEGLSYAPASDMADFIPWNAPVSPSSAVENGTWYSIPGLYHRCFARYSADSGSTSNGNFSNYSNPYVFIPVGKQVVFPNMCTDKGGAKWGYNFTNWGIEGYFDANNNGIRSAAMHGGASYYIPMIKSGEDIFFWGEEADGNPTFLVCDSVKAMSYEEIGTNVKMYLGVEEGKYLIGTTTTQMDVTGNGTPETVYQYGVSQSCPKPQAPLSFDYAFIPAFTYSEKGMFQNGAKLKLVITGDESKKVLWEAYAGAGDFTNGTFSNSTTKEFGNLKFQSTLTDKDGKEYVQTCTINEPYTINITGFQDPGVDVGMLTVRRSSYGAKALSPVRFLFQDALNRGHGAITNRNNAYGLPLQLHGLYDVMAVSDNYISNAGWDMTDMSVLKFSADGITAVAGSNPSHTDVSYAQVRTQMDWFDAKGNANYSMELPSWVTSVTAVPSPTLHNAYVALYFTVTPLPSGVSGRGAKMFIKSYMGGISDKPIYILQGDYTKEMVDAATGIDAISLPKRNITSTTVNLFGQRVGANAKGIVIKNGIKILQK